MATIQSEEVFDNGFGAEDNLKVHQLLKYFTKTSNIMSILKTNNEEVNKHILNDYIICRFLVEKKPLEEGTKFRSQQERIIFLNELKALQASLIIEYEDSPAKAEQSEQLVEIIPTPVSSSKKRKQNHQNIKELNNDEIDQFEQNRSIRMESPQFDYESYEDDISRGSSKDSYAKPHIDDVELVMLKKKNSLPKMMQKVLKPTNSLIKPRIKKELAEARKMGKLVSPKKEITEDVEPEEKTIEEEDPVVGMLNFVGVLCKF